MFPVSNNTEAGKRVSSTESLLLLKSQTIFQSQTIRQYISINSRSAKFDLSVQSLTNDDILANNIHNTYMLDRRVLYASNFPTVIKTGSANFNELLDFSGSSLQIPYDYLHVVQASYSQSDHFYKHRSGRLSKLQRATQVLY